LARLLDSAGVDLSVFHVDRAAQTGHLVTECVGGSITRRILFPGADSRLTEDEVNNAFLTSPDGVAVTTEVPPAALVRIATLSQERGVPLFLLHTTKEADVPALPPLEVFVTDEPTAAAMTGIRPGNADTCLQVAIELQKRVKTRYFVIRLGERGAFLYDGTYCHMVNSYIVREADRRGADEAFFGALIAEYMRPEREILPALTFAAAASALATPRRGDAISSPTAEEVFAFLERN
jgi:ribokinase